MLRGELDRDPERPGVRLALARLLSMRSAHESAVELLDVAPDLECFEHRQRLLRALIYDQAAVALVRKKKLDASVRALEEALRSLPDGMGEQRAEYHRRLARLAQQRGNHAAASEHLEQARRHRAVLDEGPTRRNYLALARALESRDIRLVAAQYPLRDVDDLVDLLDARPEVVFVDNAGLFEAALEHEPYEHFFSDEFAGDFGHMTAAGNRVLAESVARAILREILGDEKTGG